MIIGVDFDNTIVSYDSVFHRVARERGLIDDSVPVNKTAVRDYLRTAGHENIWTELQGYVYGPGMIHAEIFPGVRDFFSACRRQGISTQIISHRSQHPYRGEQHDLHAAARDWLDRQGFFTPDGLALSRETIFFEHTRDAKLQRITTAGCTHFIDDLPELLTEPGFPRGVLRILFDPAETHEVQSGVAHANSWKAIFEMLMGGSGSAENEIAAVAAALLPTGEKLSEPPNAIGGGRNNRAYRISTLEGRRFLLKCYSQDPADPRNRFESERLFYQFAASDGISCIPEAKGWDATVRAALLEFVDGRSPLAGEISSAEIAQAARFFAALNRARTTPAALGLPAASEACFSLEEHLGTVDRRVSRLKNIPYQAVVDQEARGFVENELVPKWADLREATANVLIGAQSRVGENQRCISPSDFGFHNSLQRDDGSFVFFDFEYAGWDDPAKTVCDFFCQPAVPAPQGYFSEFTGGVAAALALPPDAFLARCQALLPVYRLKWCCILMNEFLPSAQSRRNFALGEGAAEAAKASQLMAARAVLSEAAQIY